SRDGSRRAAGEVSAGTGAGAAEGGAVNESWMGGGFASSPFPPGPRPVEFPPRTGDNGPWKAQRWTPGRSLPDGASGPHPARPPPNGVPAQRFARPVWSPPKVRHRAAGGRNGSNPQTHDSSKGSSRMRDGREQAGERRPEVLRASAWPVLSR